MQSFSSKTRGRERALRLYAQVCDGSATTTSIPVPKPPPGGSRSLHATAIKESGFGAVVEMGAGNPSLEQLLEDPLVGDDLRHIWQEAGGLLVLRGLVDLTPEQLVEVSRVFGEVEGEMVGGRKNSPVQVLPKSGAVMRLGNTKDLGTGKLNAGFVDAGPPLPPGASPQYRPNDTHGKLAGLPIWHTDSTFRANPPVGSLFFCKQTPGDGMGATCFADTRAAFEALDSVTRERLGELECVCSLAHHDSKIASYTPGFPLLSEAARKANPPQRVPMVLTHPLTGRRALYGLNGSTCAVLPKGEVFPREKQDKADLEATEDPSVRKEWRDTLLPFVTQDQFTVVWRWEVGDLVVWDNRTTMHCATGYDHKNHTREMWRSTIVKDHPRSLGG